MPTTRSASARTRGLVLAGLLAMAVVLATACDPQRANTDFALVNTLRSSRGVAPLVRSAELDAKARDHAAAMAAQGRIFHSTLTVGVSPGWTLLGENVAVAGTVESAEAALEASAPHLSNLLNPAFNQIGIGVKTVNGKTYVVQVFAAR